MDMAELKHKALADRCLWTPPAEFDGSCVYWHCSSWIDRSGNGEVENVFETSLQSFIKLFEGALNNTQMIWSDKIQTYVNLVKYIAQSWDERVTDTCYRRD